MMVAPMLVLELAKAAPEIGIALMEGIYNGIVGGVQALIKGAIRAFTRFIDAIKDFFGIHSPSTLFAELGSYMIEGLINGILNAGALIWDAIKGIFTGILDLIKGIFSGAVDIGSSLVSGIVSGVSSAAGWVGDTASNIGSAVVSGVTTAVDVAGDVASNVGSAVSSGASKAVKFVKSWFADGTTFAPGGRAVINEEGAELVTLPTGSRVMTASATADIFGKGIASILSGIGSMTAPSMTPSFAGAGGITIHNQITTPVNVDGYQMTRAVFENWDKVAK
jgi:hypothetical protein